MRRGLRAGEVKAEWWDHSSVPSLWAEFCGEVVLRRVLTAAERDAPVPWEWGSAAGS